MVTTYGRVVRVGTGWEGMWVTFLNFLAGGGLLKTEDIEHFLVERRRTFKDLSSDLLGVEVSSLLQSILIMFQHSAE